MSGHTPGPWIAVGAWVEHPDDDVADICSCDPATINQEHLGRGYSEICANARLIAAAPAMHAEIKRLKRERRHIYDLLARIHRDGGQYTAEHGIEKSCDDAEAQVVTWLETISSVDSLIEQARIAEREACAEECETLAFDKAIAAWNKRADQSTELAALRAFAQAVMDCWPDGWGIEGDDLQRIATEHGMLRPEIRHDPCGDSCRCADHVLQKEWIDGVTCYRKTALLTGADHD